MDDVLLPVPEDEEALEDDDEGMEALDDEDVSDKPEHNIPDGVGDTEVRNEDLPEAQFSSDVMVSDVGDDQQGDWGDPSVLESLRTSTTALLSTRRKSLSAQERNRARRLAVRAALLGFHHAAEIHYTQGGLRWQGMDDTRYAAKGQYPNWADCSAFVTWCLWNGLYIPYEKPDVVNGAGWKAGFTGTMLNHGQPIRHLRNVRWGDAVIYGAPGTSGRHTAIICRVGRPRGSHVMVVSHGSENGPYFLPYNYRSDIQSIRRYIYYKLV